jgi:hypothetical protein
VSLRNYAPSDPCAVCGGHDRVAPCGLQRLSNMPMCAACWRRIVVGHAHVTQSPEHELVRPARKRSRREQVERLFGDAA